MSTDKPQRPPAILVVTPHPDDAESGAGGAIASYIAQGSPVSLLVCTNGDKGTSRRDLPSQDLVRIREEEQLAAVKLMGVGNVTFLRYPDQSLEDTSDFREKVVRAIRQHRPDIVFSMDPNRQYIIHRDHRMCGRVVLDAVFPFARDHLSYPQHLEEGLEPHKVKEVYLWASDNPDTFVDISATMERKIEALYCHTSQVGVRGEDQRLARWYNRHEEFGKKIGVRYAEAFKRIELPG